MSTMFQEQYQHHQWPQSRSSSLTLFLSKCHFIEMFKWSMGDGRMGMFLKTESYLSIQIIRKNAYNIYSSLNTVPLFGTIIL